MFFHLLLVFTLIPIVEIWILIRIGQTIHAGPTIALVLITGVIGAALARREGMRTLVKINHSASSGVMPTAELIDGLLILVAGAFLVTPGVITDVVGFLLLVPKVRAFLRRFVADYFRRHLVVSTIGMGFDSNGAGEFIDVECRDVTDDGVKRSDDSNSNSS